MVKFVEKPRFICALGGAVAAVNALPGAIPVLHSASGCGGGINNAINAGAGYLGAGYCGGLAAPSSCIQENEIMFGGEDRLEEQLKNTIELIAGDLYVILTGCMAEIVGDDVNAVAGKFEDVEILTVSTGGFKGNALYGYNLVLEALFKKTVKKSEKKTAKKVNVWGIPPAFDVFWEGNLIEIKRLLEKLGLNVNTFFTGESLEDIKNAGDAELNIVLSDVFGIEAAKVFEEEHGTPFISLNIPIGFAATEDFLLKVAEQLELDKNTVEKVINDERALYFKYFQRTIEVYNDFDFQRYGLIVADANYAIALTFFIVKELGWIPELIMVTDILSDDEKDIVIKKIVEIEESLKDKLYFDTDTSQAQVYLSKNWPQNNGERYYRTLTPAFVLGSTFDKQLADGIGAGFLSVAFPISNRVILNRGYSGYNGGLRLTEDIFSVLVAGR
jgi:nitrogenase molybdenum-iron protein beta chain